MVLSKREKNISLLTGAAVALLALNYLVYEPYIGWRADMDSLRATNTERQQNADLALHRQQANRKIEKQMREGGMQIDPLVAQANATASIHQWATERDVSIGSDNLARPQPVYKMDVAAISFRAHCSTQQMGQLLWAIESAPFPLRVQSVDITTTEEGADQLVVNVDASTISPSPATAASTGAKK